MKILYVLINNTSFPLQTHDHSVCIRPYLPPYDAAAQNVTFNLQGSFVSKINKTNNV